MPDDELNLDEIQAAEAEVAGEGLVFTFGGKKFALPGVLPMTFLLEVGKGGGYTSAAMTELLGEDMTAKFWALKPGRKVIAALDARIAKHYGLGTPGNSSASDAPSRNGSGRSRPTSSVTTD